jgi:uncharacterized protein
VRVVLDTNVLLAAYATRGLCEALFAACLESHEIVLSEHILGELRRSLTRALRLPAGQTNAIVAFVREHSELVEPEDVPATACRDPEDLPVLGTAVAARADVFVTGDRDLLDLGEYGGIPVVSPRECHRRLAGAAGT